MPLSVAAGDWSEHCNDNDGVFLGFMNRGMVEGRDSRVDFGMAEALAFGTLALHRGVRPPGALSDSNTVHNSSSQQLLQQNGNGMPIPLIVCKTGLHQDCPRPFKDAVIAETKAPYTSLAVLLSGRHDDPHADRSHFHGCLASVYEAGRLRWPLDIAAAICAR